MVPNRKERTEDLCNCDTVLHVPNITLAVPDDVLRRAKIHAAEQGTSVSELVRQYLISLAGRDEEFARLRGLQDAVLARLQDDPEFVFSASQRRRRDEIHDRAASRES